MIVTSRRHRERTPGDDVIDVVGTLGHAFEVLRNKIGHQKTDPYTVAKGLHKRGDEP